MSLLIKALNKAEEAQANNAKLQVQTEHNRAAQADKNKAFKIEADGRTKPQSDAAQNPIKTASADYELSPSRAGNAFLEAVAKPASTAAAFTELSAITPATNQLPHNGFKTPASTAQASTAQSAANVFSAKGVESKTDSARLALIAGASLIALLGMGLYFYQFVDTSSPINVPTRPLDQAVIAPETAVQAQIEQAVEKNTAPEPNMMEVAASPVEVPPAVEPRLDLAFKPTKNRQIATKIKTKKTATVSDETDFMQSEDELKADDDNEPSIDQGNTDQVIADEAVLDTSADKLKASFSANKTNKKMHKSKNNAVIASDSASIQVSKSTTEPSVNPILMSAYDAYNAGYDKVAIKLYKQVLARDVRNVDALLGLGAIAAKQGRSADANGWYGKVLELDPRNSIAKTAMLDSQSLGDELTNETSLKNMLARQPDDANLYVALGNLYAEQNQWPAAQQAYFDAYSLNKTADNAYNLAVSLDQMGKPKLALPYYVQALAQAKEASSIDKTALQARISAIQ